MHPLQALHLLLGKVQHQHGNQVLGNLSHDHQSFQSLGSRQQEVYPNGDPGSYSAPQRGALRVGSPKGVQQQTLFNPQQGFGPQVQNVGGMQPQLQAPRSPGANWNNLTGNPINYVNPQVQDNGYYYF